MPRLVDLSHKIRHGMTTYPGLPGPEIGAYLTREASRGRYAPGTEFHIAQVSLVANTGTYVDAPFHRHPDGVDVAGLALESLADLPGLVVRAKDRAARAVALPAFSPHAVRGRAVLVHTGWDRHWGTEEYGRDAPFLTRAAVQWLIHSGTALVGIDSVNIDDMGDAERPAHTLLLAAGIPIVEHLRGLDQLPDEGFRFHAVPPAVEGVGSFPVRAWARVE